MSHLEWKMSPSGSTHNTHSDTQSHNRKTRQGKIHKTNSTHTGRQTETAEDVNTQTENRGIGRTHTYRIACLDQEK